MDTEIKFELPEYCKNEFAVFALDLVSQVFAQDGAEERYQSWLKERNKTK